MKVRSMVGLVPLFAATTLLQARVAGLEDFQRRTRWLLKNRPDLAARISYFEEAKGQEGRLLLAIPTRDRLERVLRYVFDEAEFLSPHRRPIDVAGPPRASVHLRGQREAVRRRLRARGGEDPHVRGQLELARPRVAADELPPRRGPRALPPLLRRRLPDRGADGSGRKTNLLGAAREISRRLTSLFLRGPDGRRPCLAPTPGGGKGVSDDRVLFHEYFDGDTGRGLGASHQTGWTSLVVRLLERKAAAAAEDEAAGPGAAGRRAR